MATFVQGLRVGAGIVYGEGNVHVQISAGRPRFYQLINDVLFATYCKAVWDGKLRSCDNMLDGFSLIQCLAGDWQHDWDDFCTKLWRTADHPRPTCTSLHPAFRPCICACGSACGNSNTIGESVNCKRGYILYDLWGNSYLSMRFLFKVIQSFWNLIGGPLPVVPSCLSNFKTIGVFFPNYTQLLNCEKSVGNLLVAKRTTQGTNMGCPLHLWVAFCDRATVFGQHCL